VACALRCRGKHHAAWQERKHGLLECRMGVNRLSKARQLIGFVTGQAGRGKMGLHESVKVQTEPCEEERFYFIVYVCGSH